MIVFRDSLKPPWVGLVLDLMERMAEVMEYGGLKEVVVIG